jgi:hypothetical protein
MTLAANNGVTPARRRRKDPLAFVDFISITLCSIAEKRSRQA